MAVDRVGDGDRFWTSKRLDALDWLAIAISAGLAILTVYAGSVPVIGTGDYFSLSLGWPFAGVVWSFAILARVRDRGAGVAAGLMLLGSLASLAILGPVFLVILFGPIAVVASGLIAAALLGVVLMRERPRRSRWLAAPALVLLTAGLFFSGIPSVIRFAMAEPVLTAYAQQLERGEIVATPSDDGPISIGGISIYEVRRAGDSLHLVTGYVGILGDYPAGIAYLPSGERAPGTRYEHLLGAWFRWFPDLDAVPAETE